jgi:trans-2,3-dihydro-3-hydroxyanthranilate isomerase
MMLELGTGPVSCRVQGKRGAFTTRHPLERLPALPAALVARAGGLPEQALRVPPVLASVGLPFVLAELTDAGALDLARPVAEAFLEGEARYGGDGDLFAILFYVRDGARVQARMFAPLSNIPEDPATGSAAAALAAHLADGHELDLTMLQGVQMGRPSRIEASVRGDAVTIAGDAVRVMEGSLCAAALSAPASSR